MQTLAIQRVWIPADHHDSGYDWHNEFNEQAVTVVYQDIDGNEISLEKVIIRDEYKYNWTGYAKNTIFSNLTPDKLEISYHSMDVPYIWEGWYGLDPQSATGYDPNYVPEHEIYIRPLENGNISIQLPYLWIQGLEHYQYYTSYDAYTWGYRIRLETPEYTEITNYSPTLDIEGEKTWLDDEDAKAMRPSEITVGVYDGDTLVQ